MILSRKTKLGWCITCPPISQPVEGSCPRRWVPAPCERRPCWSCSSGLWVALPHLTSGWFGLWLCLPCSACPGGHVLICRGDGPPLPEVLWILLMSRAPPALLLLSRYIPTKFCLPRQNHGSSSLTGKFEEPYNFILSL